MDFFGYKDFASQGLKGQDGSRENYVTQIWRQQWKMKENDYDGILAPP